MRPEVAPLHRYEVTVTVPPQMVELQASDEKNARRLAARLIGFAGFEQGAVFEVVRLPLTEDPGAR